MNGVGIDRKHQPQTYANHSTPLLNIIHISPFSTLVGMTALSRNEMTFAPPPLKKGFKNAYADRPTDRQTDGPTDRQTGKPTHRNSQPGV